jgi:NAD(P)-dependent dehydrogenase (short-subunit alcohol dehydrogenase family)
MITLRGGMAAYRVSKAALNALTRLTAGTVRDYNIKVNSMCPGSINTSTSGAKTKRTPSQGVETTVWLATLPPSGPNGKFFKDRKLLPW